MNRKILAIITIVFLIPIALFSQVTRPIYRIISISSQYEHYTYYSTNSNTVFYYTSHTPSVIDSTVTTSTGQDGTTINTDHYTHTVIDLYDRRITEYNSYRDNEPDMRLHYVLTTDLSGKALEIYKTYQSDFVLQVYLHYNNQNKPDSMYYNNYGYLSYYKMLYDSSDRLSQSVKYYMNANNWTPSERITYYYSLNPYPYPTPLNFNTFGLYLPGYTLTDLDPLMDASCAPDSILQEVWIDSDWNSEYVIATNSITHSNGNAHFAQTWYDGIMNLEGYSYSFNNLGLLSGSNSFSDNYYSSMSISWSGPVYNDDYAQTIPPHLFTVYPNPFNTNLNIKLESKTPINSDISIYNIKGQLVRSWKDVKSNELIWDGNDTSNQPVSPGVYLIKSKLDKQVFVTKVIKL